MYISCVYKINLSILMKLRESLSQTLALRYNDLVSFTWPNSVTGSLVDNISFLRKLSRNDFFSQG